MPPNGQGLALAFDVAFSVPLFVRFFFFFRFYFSNSRCSSRQKVAWSPLIEWLPRFARWRAIVERRRQQNGEVAPSTIQRRRRATRHSHLCLPLRFTFSFSNRLAHAASSFFCKPPWLDRGNNGARMRTPKPANGGVMGRLAWGEK